jgi:hypothetical protein
MCQYSRVCSTNHRGFAKLDALAYCRFARILCIPAYVGVRAEKVDVNVAVQLGVNTSRTVLDASFVWFDSLNI